MAPPARERAVVPSGSAAVEIDRGNLERREIAVTFDCGATANGTAEILGILREAKVRTTWFMIGDWVRANPHLARQIAAEHEVAHHSDTHPDYRDLTDAQIAADLERGERTFIEVMGVSSKPLWRAPSGARDNRVLAAAASAGWPLHIFWTLGRDASGPVTGDSGDWRPFTPQQVSDNMRRAAALGNGVITVSHCDSEQTRLVLADALRAYREQGLRVTTVSEVLR
jgi:peptidoglycan/xylan/chitin deacetylase (PgdA/CDA1 family)